MTAISPNRVLHAETVHVPDELKVYFQNKFVERTDQILSTSVDETYIDSWQEYVASLREGEAVQLLKKCYPQLNFPIQEGINKTQDYIDAVLKGKPQATGSLPSPIVGSPESVRVELHTSFAGKVPILFVADEEDFVRIVQCLVYKNNPMSIPQSMGALLANGVNNWARIHALKAKWLLNDSAEAWSHEFSKNVLPNPGLYKDKLIVLSDKPYSNVPAEKLNLTQEEWLAYSLSIRLEHECTHLYTLKRYGCASNNLHDELIADYVGIRKTIGSYDKKWMLTFMGLEDYPNYRKGARLENYLGDAAVSSENFGQLTTIVKQAIDTIFWFDIELGAIQSQQDQLYRIDALCQTDLLGIASANGPRLLRQKYKELTS